MLFIVLLALFNLQNYEKYDILIQIYKSIYILLDKIYKAKKGIKYGEKS